MNDPAWPKFPNAYVSDDESTLTDGAKFDSWTALMMDRVQGTSENLGWKFKMGETALSRSADFPIIFRAKVKWMTEDGVYETVEVLWKNTVGECGGVSAPIEELLIKTRQPFGMSGRLVHFSDENSPKWMKDLSHGDNDGE
ncbi:MAG: hypothetical protein AAF269_08890 [Pseudomonadota bacterium]